MPISEPTREELEQIFPFKTPIVYPSRATLENTELYTEIPLNQLVLGKLYIFIPSNPGRYYDRNNVGRVAQYLGVPHKSHIVRFDGPPEFGQIGCINKHSYIVKRNIFWEAREIHVRYHKRGDYDEWVMRGFLQIDRTELKCDHKAYIPTHLHPYSKRRALISVMEGLPDQLSEEHPLKSIHGHLHDEDVVKEISGYLGGKMKKNKSKKRRNSKKGGKTRKYKKR
jgi:hypothetical protein